MIRFGKYVASAATMLVAGCSGTSSQLQLAVLNSSVRTADPIIEVYSRVAQGAMACWFGQNGFLKATHVFYADVAPASSGQQAEIIIHERDTTQPRPWGRRAFRVTIATVDGETAVEAENIAMKDDVAGRMRADVFQWTQGKTGCSPESSPASAVSLPARSWRKPEQPAEPSLMRGSSLDSGFPTLQPVSPGALAGKSPPHA
jgi:hypothetical protein